MSALGPMAHGEHKNKVKGGHLRCCWSGFGSYGQGNFPGHDVLCVLPEMVKNEFIWVFMHMDGCNRAHGNGGEKEQGKKSPKRESMGCFVVHGRGEKNQEVGRSDHGDQGWARGGGFKQSYACTVWIW